LTASRRLICPTRIAAASIRNIGKALKPKTRDHTGGTPQETGGDVGLRAAPDAAEAPDHRGHGKNAGI
jgi:hypothetical protein